MLSLHTQKITILLMSKKMYIRTSKKSECHWKDYLGCPVCKQLMHNNIYMGGTCLGSFVPSTVAP